MAKKSQAPGLAPIQIDRDADGELEDYCRRHRKKKRPTLSALVGWFTRQPPIVQRVVEAEVDEGMEPAYAAALRALAKKISEDYEARNAVLETGVRPGGGGLNEKPEDPPSPNPESAPDAKSRRSRAGSP